MTTLRDITHAVRDDLERRKSAVAQAQLEQAIRSRPEGRPFSEALAMPGICLIAEYKRRSPAAGDLPRAGEPVGDLVRAYERGGASALSILTDGPHFGGSLEDLRQAARTPTCRSSARTSRSTPISSTRQRPPGPTLCC